MGDEKKQEEQKPQQEKPSEEDKPSKEDKPSEEDKPKMRQIVIEFDQRNINIAKAEVSSNFELSAVLERILRKLD